MATQLLLRAGLGGFPRYTRISPIAVYPGLLDKQHSQIALTVKVEHCCRKEGYVGLSQRTHVRQYCTTENPDGKFKSLYRNPNVTYIRVIQLAKLSMLGITPVWILTFAAVTGQLSSTFLGSFFFIFGSIALLEAGKFASHVACNVHVNDATKQVKITHFDFMGKKKEILVELDKLATEATNTKARIYLKPNEEDKFLLYLNLTTPEQREEMTSYFGDLYK